MAGHMHDAYCLPASIEPKAHTATAESRCNLPVQCRELDLMAADEAEAAAAAQAAAAMDAD